jgi:hypothetical protein
MRLAHFYYIHYDHIFLLYNKKIARFESNKKTPIFLDLAPCPYGQVAV